VRPGSDVTVVATQLMRHRVVEAAELLTSTGISVEVIDLRTLVPFDLDTIIGSLERTNRLVVVQEASARGQLGRYADRPCLRGPVRAARRAAAARRV
jgi:pyruvate/2-oxoglutarate/acetoin dehydrogenase E1 component